MRPESKGMFVLGKAAAFLLAATLAVAPAAAQQVTGQLGSPSATTTIDGKQLPPPPPQFGGVIKQSATDSKSWWPPRVVPPKGAPNVLLIISGTYNQLTAYNGVMDVPEPLQLLHYKAWGSDKTYPHMAVPWAWAFDTPFK